MHSCMVTTMDNPWNPFTNFTEWYAYDEFCGYHTCALLAAFSCASSDLDQSDYEAFSDLAINDLIEFNPFGLHFKVYDYEAETVIPLANEAYKTHPFKLDSGEHGEESDPTQ